MISEELNKQIKFEFGKSFEQLNDEEKRKITTVTLKKKDLAGKPTNMNISELRELLGLKKCLISNFEITDEDMIVLSKLSSLEWIQFSDCTFKNKEKSFENESLKLLIVNNCNGNLKRLFSKNENLEEVKVVWQKGFNASDLVGCDKLTDIFLQRTEVKNIEILSALKSVKKLNLDGSTFSSSGLNLIRRANREINIEYEKNAIPERE
jgi:hypothetical protein